MAPDGVITTVAGTGTAGYNGDGAAATASDLNGAFNVTLNTEGDYLIVDTFSHRIRLVDAAAPPAVPPPPPPPPPPSPCRRRPRLRSRRRPHSAHNRAHNRRHLHLQPGHVAGPRGRPRLHVPLGQGGAWLQRAAALHHRLGPAELRPARRGQGHRALLRGHRARGIWPGAPSAELDHGPDGHGVSRADHPATAFVRRLPHPRHRRVPDDAAELGRPAVRLPDHAVVPRTCAGAGLRRATCSAGPQVLAERPRPRSGPSTPVFRSTAASRRTRSFTST